MLPGGSDALYREVLSTPHRHYVRVEVWSGTGVLLNSFIPAHQEGDPEGGLVFYDGNLTASLGSRVARNVMLSIPMDLYPIEPTDLLAPFGNELRIFLGVTLGDGSDEYTWQVFRGRIRDVEVNSDGNCTVLASDRSADVADVNFVSPQNSQPGNTVYAEWLRLIADAVPDATFGASDTFTKTVEALTWDFNRASALDEMARSVGAVWYPLANGDFVLRRFPWAVSSPPVVTLTDEPGGTVNGWRVRRSRDSIFNVVTVSGERLNGDAPVFATASDNTVGSPTSVTGNFGVRSRVERLQTPSTQGGALGTAESLLRTYIAPIEEWTLVVVPDAALELGDVLRLLVNGRDVIQVVTGFSLPLGLGSDMSISTRSLVVGGAE